MSSCDMPDIAESISSCVAGPRSSGIASKAGDAAVEAPIGIIPGGLDKGAEDAGALEGGGLGGTSFKGNVDCRWRPPKSKAGGRPGIPGDDKLAPGGGGGRIPISPGILGGAPKPGGPMGGPGGREGGAPKPGGGPIAGMGGAPIGDIPGGGPGGGPIGDIPGGGIEGAPIGDIPGGPGGGPIGGPVGREGGGPIGDMLGGLEGIPIEGGPAGMGGGRISPPEGAERSNWSKKSPMMT